MTEQKARHLFRTYQRKLGLSNIKIRLDFVDDKEINEKGADCELVNKRDNTFVIRVNRDDSDDESHIREKHVHELLHVLLWQLVMKPTIFKEHKVIKTLIPLLK